MVNETIKVHFINLFYEKRNDNDAFKLFYGLWIELLGNLLSDGTLLKDI